MTRRPSWLQFAGMVAAVGAPLILMARFRDVVPGAGPMLIGLAAATALIAAIAPLARRGRAGPTTTTHVLRAASIAPASIALVLAIVAAVQFNAFYADYMGDYRRRFIPETDGNVRDVLEAVIQRSPRQDLSRRQETPAIYLGFRFGVGEWGSYYWLFYLHKHQREDLLVRTINDSDASQFSRDRICHLPAGSIAATRSGWDKDVDALIERMIEDGDVTLERLVRGEPTYWLLKTTGTCAGTTAAANEPRGD